MSKLIRIPLFVLLATLSPAGLAYVGPGLGAGALGVLIGLVASVLLAVFSIFWFPLKRLFKGRKRKTEPPEPEEDREE